MEDTRKTRIAPPTVQERRERHRQTLRSDLIEAARQLVQEGGYDGLTIRKLAKRVGYAPMSVYSYFADKQAILLALAEDRFALLARRIQENAADDPLEALRAVLTEYAAFGLGNPNEYRIVFMTEKTRPTDAQAVDGMDEGNPALQAFLSRVEACIAAGRIKGDPFAIATMLWSIAHGTISLMITFPFHEFGDREAFLKRMCDFALAGLQGQDTQPLTDAPGPICRASK